MLVIRRGRIYEVEYLLWEVGSNVAENLLEFGRREMQAVT